MAQPRRARRTTKHRGNAAGVIEARGRTGRKPTAAEKGGKAGQAARERATRVDRRDKPPTWRSALVRGMAAAVILLLALLLILPSKSKSTAAAYFPIALLLYTPVSYYTDLWMYRRRQRKKTGQPRADRKQAPR
jgi:hypothetical protein